MKNKSKIRALDLSLERILTFVVLGLFIGVVPMFVHSQWLTGPFINALLLLTCVLVGPMEAVVLGLVPSTVALSNGLLPLPLAPMIPFIMISNAIFVAVFYYLYKKSFSVGILIGAFLKFLFLFGVSTFLAQSLLSETFLPKVALIMSWPQFVTALLGGVFAFVILKFFKKI
jgi:hypothetical protein